MDADRASKRAAKAWCKAEAYPRFEKWRDNIHGEREPILGVQRKAPGRGIRWALPPEADEISPIQTLNMP
jgi:hypothetical protein